MKKLLITSLCSAAHCALNLFAQTPPPPAGRHSPLVLRPAPAAICAHRASALRHDATGTSLLAHVQNGTAPVAAPTAPAPAMRMPGLSAGAGNDAVDCGECCAAG